MIPQSLLTVVAFFVFVLPGIIFEQRRARANPPRSTSAFQEASSVAATSLVFGLATLATMSAIRHVYPAWFPIPDEWYDMPTREYLDLRLGILVRTALWFVALSCAFAFLAG